MAVNRMLVLLASGAVLLFGPSAARAQCRTETEISRRLVVTYATQSTSARPAGVPVVSADRVRLLTDPDSGGVCAQLFAVFRAQWRDPDDPRADWHWSYYQVGDQYYVVAHRTAPPATRNADGTFNISLNWSPLFVVDRNYRVIASIAR
jgi:hypothetical protein